jgi:hypothetical protein
VCTTSIPNASRSPRIARSTMSRTDTPSVIAPTQRGHHQ